MKGLHHTEIVHSGDNRGSNGREWKVSNQMRGILRICAPVKDRLSILLSVGNGKVLKFLGELIFCQAPEALFIQVVLAEGLKEM